MASVGPQNGGTFVDDTAVGTLIWSNPSNAQTSDDAYATATKSVGTGIETTHYLKVTNFDFSAIPDGATIDGILVEIEKKGTTGGAGNVSDSVVKLVIGGVVTGNNKNITGQWSSTDAISSYGGAADLWGTTPTAAQIKASNFGMVISASVIRIGGFTVVGSVDHIRITVTYTAPATGKNTLQGVAIASVATIQGEPIAEVKSIQGVV